MRDQRLERLTCIPPFESKLQLCPEAKTTTHLTTLQLNLGKLCNLSCKHCHQEAGPNRTECMPRSVMEACLNLLEENAFETVDITGGAPELNANFRWFVTACAKKCKHVIVRTNLVVLLDAPFADLPAFYRENRIHLVASLPHYTASSTDRVRGEKVFLHTIAAMRLLNAVGYAKEDGLVLDLVYNPSGAFLPPAQNAIEAEYREHLWAEQGVCFNHLYTIINNPIGRFGAFLERSDNLEPYLTRLHSLFNPNTLETMMCRSQLSVDWDGQLYDCDFNLAAQLSIAGHKTVFDCLGAPLKARRIQFGNHCYACTAGQGSSCGGATAIA